MNQYHSTYFLQSSASTISKARSLRKRMTPEEKLLWSHLRKNALQVRFRKQVPFGPYILDFFCVTERIAIELDGDQHFSKKALKYDRERDNYLRSHKISILRFRNQEVKNNLDGVLTIVWELCNQRKFTPCFLLFVVMFLYNF